MGIGIRGKPRKRNTGKDDDDTLLKRGRGAKKTPVVGMVERGGDVMKQKELKFKDLKK